MSTGIFSIGITGMSAAQLGLLTTEHNITNSTTPGYNRQRTLQSANTPVMTGAGAVGQGVNISTIERVYNSFLVSQVNRAQASVSELDTYYSQIKQIDNMLADANAGLSPALQDFFSGVQQVAANPSLASARQSLLSSAQSLTSRFQAIESRLGELYEGVNSQISSTVGTINSYAQQIAVLNERIIVAQSAGNQPANDLLDQRDQLVTDLNKLIKVSTTTNTDGSYNVFIGTGQQLVVNTQVNTLAAVPSDQDSSRFVVALKTFASTIEMPENIIAGGALGGLVSFRAESLDTAANSLGRLAATLALTFNAQHALGQDQLGNVTGNAGFIDDFFTISQPTVFGNANNALGAPTITASFIDPPPNNGNFYTDLTGSDYQLSFNAGTLTLTRLSDNKAWTGASVAAINTALAAEPQGFALATTGAGFANGDSYLIQPTRTVARNLAVNASVAADTRRVAVAAPMRTSAASTNTGTATISSGSVTTGYDLTSLPVTLNYTSGNLSNFPNGTVNVTVGGVTTPYVITGPADTVPYTNGATISFAGISFRMDGVPNNGDSFTIQRNTAGVADNRNALLLGKLQTQNTVAGGTATLQAAYAQLVSDNGNKTREIQVTGSAQEKLLEQASASRDSASGVNLDEEAANLIRYQQAYQASAKMLEIGSKLFDVLLSIKS